MDPTLAMIEWSFVNLAEAMPEAGYAYRPASGATAGVRTFGEQVKHVYSRLNGVTPPASAR